MRVPDGFEPIDSAQFVEDGTKADLLLPTGQVVRATWEARESQRCDGATWKVTGWWTSRGRMIPLYTPRHWKPLGPVARTQVP